MTPRNTPTHTGTNDCLKIGYSMLSKCISFKTQKRFSLILILFLVTATTVVFLHTQATLSQRSLVIYGSGQNRLAKRLKPVFMRNIQNDNRIHAGVTDSIELNKGNTSTHSSTPVFLTAKILKKTIYPLDLIGDTILENTNLCSSVPDLKVLIIVHSAPKHFDRRRRMRTSWANETYYKELGSARVMFLLGTVDNATLQKQIAKEFADHQDILQGDFVDAYRNLTLKGVMAYRWMASWCKNAKFILKVDDDVVVNMYKLFTEILPQYSDKKKQIVCNHILPGTMPILRNNKSKWFVEDLEFKGHKFYPRYCSGFTVIFSNDVIPAIYKSAIFTPFFWVDDVYLYGLAPGRVPGIKYNGFKDKSVMLDGRKAINCYKNESQSCDFLVTGAGPGEASTIWSHMTKLFVDKAMNTTKTDIVSTTLAFEFNSTTKNISVS